MDSVRLLEKLLKDTETDMSVSYPRSKGFEEGKKWAFRRLTVRVQDLIAQLKESEMSDVVPKSKWDTLLEDFPRLFPQRLPMECGEGWEPLIRSLCEKLDLVLGGMDYKDIEGSPFDEVPFQVEQVKEKFGGLRFYVSWGTPEIWGLIEEAEAKSFKVCEECGKEGKLTGKRWMRTLCEGCESKFSKKDT